MTLARASIVAASAAGCVLPFSWAPFNIPALAILAIAALFWAWSSCAPWQAFRLGWLCGFFYFGIGIHWLHISIDQFSNINAFFSWAITLALAAFLAVYPALAGYLAKCLWQRCDALNFLCLLPACWVATEWCRSWVLTGLPWLRLGSSQTDTWLAGYIPVLGVYGGTFIVCVLGGGLALIVQRRQVLPAGVVVFGILALGWSLHGKDWTVPDGKEIRVRVAQSGIPQDQKWHREMYHSSLANYLDLSRSAAEVDLIVWPETAIAKSYQSALDDLRAISGKLPPNALFMTGLVWQHGKRYHNSVLLRIGEEDRFYHKHHLVPFGEYFPLRSLLEPLLRRFQVPMSNFAPADDERYVMDTPLGVLGLSICYEIVYNEIIRKSLPEAGVLFNLSNDAWFGNSIGPHQHLQHARMRALESGRYIVRAANTGISAVIDHRGQILRVLPLESRGTFDARIPLMRGATFWSRTGNLPILAVNFSILLIFSLRRRLRDRL
ncbi:MAG: apolipoprotein N-acyltransferase [Candidatus Eutrophobiaceae bacterium]